MTRAAWAERKVDAICQWTSESLRALVIKLLLAEHRRAVREVQRELDTCVRQRESETDVIQRDRLGGAMLACSNILAALQKGRT